MGNIFSTRNPEETRRIWPVRSWYHVPSPDQYDATKFGHWDPAKYHGELKYPAQEPAKDY